MLSRAVPVTQVQAPFLKFALYGRNRVGKTTLACQFPKPLLLVSFEPAESGGATSVRKVPGVDYIKVASTREAALLAEELKGDKKYKTHVLDTVTSYQDLVLQELLDLPAVPEQLNWGMVSRDQYRQRSEKTREGLRLWLRLRAHTVCCAKERDHNSSDRDKPKMLRGSTDESFFAPDLGGGTADWFLDNCDYVVRLYLEKELRKRVSKVAGKDVTVEEETGRIVRRLRTLFHPNYFAGFRSDTPEAIPEFVENPTYLKLEKLIRGEKL